MKTSFKKIGVLGGMGPESTAEFYKELIRQCQLQFGSQKDEDYPEIVIYNLPIPDVLNTLDWGLTKTALVVGLKKLESIGVDFIVIPCNTVQVFFQEMQQSISVPLLNIIEETAKKVKEKNYSKIGLLATKTSIDRKLFDKVFEKYSIELIKPTSQLKIDNIILNILSGKKKFSDKKVLLEKILELQNKGADAIVLGCTDLPPLFEQNNKFKVVNSIKVLAEATIKFASKNT